jgi:glycosyltransferase involved in cell wall biosynthesis
MNGSPLVVPGHALVDVILPAYNGAAMIRAALDSALAQDVPLRVIVVDDGSTDNSADIARSYGSRVHVIVQENQGVSGARNTALAAATAPYVAFLDQDDVWKPGKLRRQFELIERHPEVGMVFTDMTILEPDGTVLEDGFLANTRPYADLNRDPLGGDAHLLSADLGAALVRENFISPSTALVRTSALREIGGFDTRFRLVDDAECWMRLLHRWRGIAIEDRLVLSYAWGGNASFVKWRAMIRERIAIGDKAVEQPAVYPPNAASYFSKEKPLSLYRLGLGELRAGNVPEARSLFAESLGKGWRMATALALLATALPAFARDRLLRLKRATGWRWNTRVE